MPRVDAYYPPSPENVPEELTRPSPEYQRRVLLVVFSLVLFLLIYIGMIFALIGLFFLSLLLFPLGLIITFPTAFMILFLVKGFFKKQEKEKDDRIEITEEDQPLLFDFIERVCTEVGAPFPRKVFVSSQISPAVLPPTSLISLIRPTGLDLLIGLGSVNVVNLSEFKSDMAHEFGHFSQKSTRLGGWVYNANRLIRDMVFGHDWFDNLLEAWMRWPPAIAWVAYILAGTVWLLRKVMEGFFFLFHLLWLSVMRQMEFNADLVSVVAAGSDACVHSLYRYGFAGETWEQMMEDLRAAAQHKLYSSDIFYHANHTANYLRKIRKDPKLGIPPPLPDDPRDTEDLFKPDAEKPSIWTTHPTLYEREQNAKQYYIRTPIDERSAWVLFTDPQEIREEVTYRFYRAGGVPKRELEMVPPEEVQTFIDDEHAETTYDPRYHDVYQDRPLEIKDLDKLVTEAKKAAWPEGRLERVHQNLYDDELKEWMEGRKSRLDEFELLRGLASGDLELKTEDLEFRGRKYDIDDAKYLLKKVDKELERDREELKSLDRRVFLVHYQMAMPLGKKWVQELDDRYDFHLTCQTMYFKLLTERAQVEGAVNYLQSFGKGGIPYEGMRRAVHALREAHKVFYKCLRTADDLPIPALKNLKKGKPLGPFLLDRKLVPRLSRRQNYINLGWVAEFHSQVSEVIAKLCRIHFKSLGGVLTLQDKIYQEWKDRLAALPTAEPVPAKS